MRVFGDDAVRNSDLSAFGKFTDAIYRARFQHWNHVYLDPGLKLYVSSAQAENVNALVNEERYVTDFTNYGERDYWSTPKELHERGGDCEDYALAKYLALRALGFDISAMRIVVLRMVSTGGAHAVLAVRAGEDVTVLDNREPTLQPQEQATDYREIYSINEAAWWFYPRSARVRTWRD